MRDRLQLRLAFEAAYGKFSLILMKTPLAKFACLALVTLFSVGSLFAAGTKPPASGDLLNLKDPNLMTSLKSVQNSVLSMAAEGSARGVKVEVAPGNATPGLNFPCPAEGWDLSGYTGVKAEVANVGTVPAKVDLRADNAGDWQKNPWNAEFVMIPPGGSATVTVRFGTSYGAPGYNLDPHSIISFLLFVESPTQPSAIVVKSLQAVK